MNPTASSMVQFTRRLAAASSFALGLAACGAASPPLGEREQPISGGDSEESGDDACAAGVAPGDASAAECQVTARGLCFANAEAACACAGCGHDECALAESFPAQAVCPSSAGGSDDPDAPVSSDPDTPVSSDPNGGTSSGSPGACAEGVSRSSSDRERCDFIVADACFDSAESACACAGCDARGCIVLESHPAQVRCL